MNTTKNDLVKQDANTRDVHNETRKTEKREQRKQRGLWQRRHKLNIVEREELFQLNKKFGTYTGPKQSDAANLNTSDSPIATP